MLPIFMNHEFRQKIWKTVKTLMHAELVFNLADTINSKRSDKYIALSNLSLQKYKNVK